LVAADVADLVGLAVEMIKVGSARFAGVVYVVITVRGNKTLALEIPTLAYDAPTSARNHEQYEIQML
jgi:hypothetical protein